MRLPRFDKAGDDRAPESTWPTFAGPPDAILLDGWCLGALPDALGDAPINLLEAEEDAAGHWRARIRAELTGRYRDFVAAFDAILYLRPPNWETVRCWRAEQEVENLGRPLTDQDHARLDRFMMHYERITRGMMAGGHMATVVVDLNEARNLIRVRPVPNPPTPPP